MTKKLSVKFPKLKLSKFARVDRVLFIAILVLTLFGLLSVFNASSVVAFRDFGDQYHFVKDQAVFALIGIIVMCVFSIIDYHIWYKAAIPLLVITLIFLVAVFIPGLGIKVLGAKRWINLGFFSLQPTEFAKLALSIYLSAWFTFKEKGRLAPFIFLLILVLGLVILQPDLGTAVIIAGTAGVLYFISGANIMHFLLLLPVGFISVSILAFIVPYRLARITTFLNPQQDPLGSSYHIRQILIALGAGGWLVVGLCKSRQKYEYLPEATTDYIFEKIAEEIGFLGSLLLLIGFMIIIYRAFIISRRAPDRFGQLLAGGIGAWFAIQSVINLGAMVALVPLTGVPLPLISY
ncbi:MAG: putative peptidoglycan glycosyltransferase FtsW, partial [Patescibacteria group bacterium]